MAVIEHTGTTCIATVFIPLGIINDPTVTFTDSIISCGYDSSSTVTYFISRATLIRLFVYSSTPTGLLFRCLASGYAPMPRFKLVFRAP